MAQLCNLDIYLIKNMKPKQREVALVFLSLVDSALVKNIFAVYLAVLLISQDLSGSAEVIKIKSDIANDTLVQLVTFKIAYVACLLKTYLKTNLSLFLPRTSFSL